MTKIQKDYRNWIIWTALVVSLSLIAWLLFAIKDNIFQPKALLILLLCFVAYGLIKGLPTPEQVMRDKPKSSQRKPIAVYVGKPTEDALATRLAHLEEFINRLGFSSDKVVSFMADDSDRVCKDLALKSICVSDHKLRQNFNNPDLDVEKTKDWLISNLTSEPLTEEQLTEQSMRHKPDHFITGQIKCTNSATLIGQIVSK